MRRLQFVLAGLFMIVSGCGYSWGDLDLLDPQPDPFSRDAVNFVVVGDWGRAGWFRQRNVAEAMAKACRRIDCRFVVSTGDNFYIDGVDGVADAKWSRSYENIYTQDALQIPWYPSLGNHDYLGSVQAQIDYSQKSDRWRMPDRYFSVEFGVDDTTRALIVIIDTVELVEMNKASSEFIGQAEWNAERQLSWIDSTLAASTADWRFVVGHHPVYSASARHSDSPVLRERIKPVLKEREVDAYIAGHVHSLQHLVVDDINYFVSGGGSLAYKVGDHRAVRFAAGVSGFMAVSLTPETMGVQFIDFKGSVGYAAEIENQDALEEAEPAAEAVER